MSSASGEGGGDLETSRLKNFSVVVTDLYRKPWSEC